MLFLNANVNGLCTKNRALFEIKGNAKSKILESLRPRNLIEPGGSSGINGRQSLALASDRRFSQDFPGCRR